ncbi:MAG: Ig-like domain-containing protein [Fibrobacter sp.]|nr:Ig-like domain-containing protein [Fibrobacter sp.]
MKHKLLTLASAAALLAACSDTAVSDANDEIKEKGTVTFFVYDVLTRMPLEDVANYYRTEDKTKYTDSTGTIVWTGVDIGKSYFDFQLDGYAMKRHDVVVEDIIKHDVARVNDNVEKVPMYELGVGAKGQFFYEDVSTGEWKPAPGATIYAKYTDAEIYPNEVYVKTDDNGFYEFKNLAANAEFSLNSERFAVDSVIYEAVGGFEKVNERKGVLKEIVAHKAPVASLEPVLLSSNLSALEAKDDIKMVFSELLEKDSLTTNNIKVIRVIDNTTEKEVAINISLGEDGKTVIIKPAAGEWADGKDYYVNFTVWSVLNKKVNEDDPSIKVKNVRTFTVGSLAVPGPVKNLRIKLDDDDNEMVSFNYVGDFNLGSEVAGKSDLTYNETVTVVWDGIEKNVSAYNVYVKGDKENDADYVFAGSVNAPDTTFAISIAKVFNKGKYLMFPQNKFESGVIKVMVLPKNASGESLAKDAKVLEVKTFERADDDVYEMQTSEYITAAKLNVKLAGGSAVYECSSEKIDDCATYATSSYPSEKFYAGKLVVEATYNKDAAKMTAPSGFEIYSNVDDEWIKCDASLAIGFTSAVIDTSDACSPFKNGAREYAKKDAKDFLFAVVPYFGTGKSVSPAFCSDPAYMTEDECVDAGETWTPSTTTGYKISQTDLGAKNGVYTTSEDFQEFIDAWAE